MPDRIIQQNGYELCQLNLIPHNADVFINVALNHFSLIKCNAFKCKHLTRDDAGKIHRFHWCFRVFRFGEIQKLLHKISHAFIFILDICQPLVFPKLSGKKLCGQLQSR